MAKTEYSVIGFGRFGEQVANQLKELGKSVLVIDGDDVLIDKASRLHEYVIKANAADINALSDCGIKNVKHVIVSTSNIENSIMICANLKQLGVQNILARAKNATHERVLKTMGITNVVIPEINAANRIAISLVYNLGADITAINKELCWIKTVITNPSILHKDVTELGFREKYDAMVVSIERKDQSIFPIIKNTQFKLGDIVSIVCKNSSIKKVLDLVSNK